MVSLHSFDVSRLLDYWFGLLEFFEIVEETSYPHLVYVLVICSFEMAFSAFV